MTMVDVRKNTGSEFISKMNQSFVTTVPMHTIQCQILTWVRDKKFDFWRQLKLFALVLTNSPNEYPLKPHFYIENWGLQGYT